MKLCPRTGPRSLDLDVKLTADDSTIPSVSSKFIESNYGAAVPHFLVVYKYSHIGCK